MATKLTERITDERKNEIQNEVGNGHSESCDDNEIAVLDCESRQSVLVKLVN